MKQASASSRILLKSLGLEFYRKHAGLFFVLLYFCFGFMRGEEHYQLIMAALHSPRLLSGYWFLWSMFALLCLHFNWQSLQERQNQFLYLLRLFPKKKKALLLAKVFVLQYLPVLLYASIMVAVASFHQLWWPAFLCTLFIFLIIGSGILLNQLFLRTPGRKNPLLLKFRQSMQGWRKPAFCLPLLSLFVSHKFSFLLSKAAACLVLILVGHMYSYASYDTRFAFLALVLASLGNSMLLYQLHYFDEKQMSFQRNFPLSIRQRFASKSLAILLLMLPETILLLRHFHPFFEFRTLLQMVVLLFSYTQLLYGYLYTQDFLKEKFLLHACGFVLLYYFVIIFHTPAWLQLSFNLLLGYFLFSHFYYRYETEIK